jgi:hypothetical protein
MWSLCLLALGAIACLACGGIATIDAGEGGASSSDGTSTSTGVGSCQTGLSCCEWLCERLAPAQCFGTMVPCTCDILSAHGGPSAECKQSIGDAYVCLAHNYPSSIRCEDGQTEIVCGLCDAPLASAESVCGFDLADCAP